MVDLFPFLALDKSASTEIQVKQIVDYLARFKEELEFTLASIMDTESKLTDEQIAQLSSLVNNSTNVAEVINSKEFKIAIADRSLDIHLNLETGCIDYGY